MFRVAPSLDRLLVGQSTIGSQVKDSYKLACDRQATGKVLNRLFHAAFATSKEIHATTGIAKGRVSVAGVAIAWPELTTWAARSLGIRRGADLVLYCAVVVMMVGFLMVYSRLRQVRRDLTLVVRHLALLEADGPPEAVSDTPDAAPDE